MAAVYVTGTGIVTGLGYGKRVTMEALRKHQSAVCEIKYLDTIHHELPVSEVPFSNDEMMHILGINDNIPMTRTALMGRLALKEAMEEASLDPQKQKQPWCPAPQLEEWTKARNIIPTSSPMTVRICISALMTAEHVPR